MAILPFVHTGLKAFAAFWALVTFAVAAALMSELDSDFGSGNVNDTNFAAGNAIIAAGVLAFLYFTVAVALIMLLPDSILISVAVDTGILAFLFVFFLAASAALSTEGNWFSYYSGFREGSLGQGTLALSWIMTVLILGILLLEVIYTLRHYGGSSPTWRTPFNRLLAYGAKDAPGGVGAGTAGAHVESGVPMSSVPPSAAPATSTPVPVPAQPTTTATAIQPLSTQNATATESMVTPFPHPEAGSGAEHAHTEKSVV